MNTHWFDNEQMLEKIVSNPKQKVLELIMNPDEKEKFINEYLDDPATEAYRLDGEDEVAYGGDIVIAGINGKFFKDEDSYAKYLMETEGYEIFKLPHIHKEVFS